MKKTLLKEIKEAGKAIAGAGGKSRKTKSSRKSSGRKVRKSGSAKPGSPTKIKPGRYAAKGSKQADVVVDPRTGYLKPPAAVKADRKKSKKPLKVIKATKPA